MGRGKGRKEGKCGLGGFALWEDGFKVNKGGMGDKYGAAESRDRRIVAQEMGRGDRVRGKFEMLEGQVILSNWSLYNCVWCNVSAGRRCTTT